MADAEDEAINQVEDEEAGKINPAPPAATTTTAPPTALSLPPPLSAAAENATQQQTQEASGLKLVSEPYMRESESSRAVAGGAIPKRPPPGLQLPAAGIVPFLNSYTGYFTGTVCFLCRGRRMRCRHSRLGYCAIEPSARRRCVCAYAYPRIHSRIP